MDRDQKIGFALSGVSGFVDTAGFVLLFRLFTAHVTGNFVLAGAALALDRDGIWGRLGTMPVFAVAVLLAAWISKRNHDGLLSRLLLVEAAFLFLFAIGGIVLSPSLTGGPDNPVVFLVASLGVIAMGIQNGTMRLALPANPPTTVMTGNLTNATMDSLEYFLAQGECRNIARKKLARTLPVLGGFTIGAIVGGTSAAFIHYWGVLLPCAVLVMLALSAKGPVPPNAGEGTTLAPMAVLRVSPKSQKDRRVL